MTDHGPVRHLGFACRSCGKFCYESRRTAKADARRMSRTELSAYRCPDDPRFWHLGHLPDWVIDGNGSRDQIHHGSRP